MSLKLGIRNKIRRSRAAGGFVGLLDQPFATGATAAYSLRLLRAKHSGGLVRVRADDSGTDKGEADVLPRLQPDGSKIIELNSPIENLNTKAQNRLGAPAGGGDKVFADLVDSGGANYDGFVSKWYRQTPNKNDATQSNASEQPKIVSSGSVIKDSNGNPSIDYTNSEGLQVDSNINSTLTGSINFTFYVKTEIFKNAVRNPLLAKNQVRSRAGGTDLGFDLGGNQFNTRISDRSELNLFAGGSFPLNTTLETVSRLSSTDLEILDGQANIIGEDKRTINPSNRDNLFVGYDERNKEALNGLIYEIIIFGNAKSNSEIQKISSF